MLRSVFKAHKTQWKIHVFLMDQHNALEQCPLIDLDMFCKVL